MDIEAFRASLAGEAPSLPPPLRALWHAARGEWNEAHRIVQADGGTDAAWVHAHLHRVHGEQGNARYWYRKAGRPEPGGEAESEREAITAALLEALGQGRRSHPPIE